MPGAPKVTVGRIQRCSRVDRALMAGLESFTRAARAPTRVRLSLGMGWVRIGFLIASSHQAPCAEASATGSANSAIVVSRASSLILSVDVIAGVPYQPRW